MIEQGVGMDRMIWKLPVLKVDDFASVTPLLLRTAYIEALYQVDEFEFIRLTQSFWWNVIMTISRTKNAKIITDFFPMEAEDSTFTRPLRNFDCWKTKSCGKGTKRIPKKMC